MQLTAPDMSRFLALAQGWDSHDGEPIDPRAIEAVRVVIESTAIVPTSRGGLQIEMHGLGWDVEIEFDFNGNVESVLIAPPQRART